MSEPQAKNRPRPSKKLQARYAKRRKNRLDRVENDLSPQQWQWLRETWGGRCAYCLSKTDNPQRDCVQAISRGGRYTIENVVPACASCNASKHNSEVTSWLRRKKLSERLFLERYAQTLQLIRAIE